MVSHEVRSEFRASRTVIYPNVVSSDYPALEIGSGVVALAIRRSAGTVNELV